MTCNASPCARDAQAAAHAGAHRAPATRIDRTGISVRAVRGKFVTAWQTCRRKRLLERLGMKGGSGDDGRVRWTRCFVARRDAADAVSAARNIDCKASKCAVRAVLWRMSNFIQRVREKK
ncbi:hypothetical protein BMULJ_01618 [Burkholderia multivorans ATCC 17616]|uniref:Uncharacterized protein n=1 Tax=Burkholderia multivorans (strain ATCC 17616 / 249) TaxID=395019 RepID=A0A0H3KJH0_BURM1|nr:hypothetical protein BMULJ_01618 [Burkholderia multivorans ATCC 17616]